MMEKVRDTVMEMRANIEAIQGNEASLFDPTIVNEEITQSGDGVLK
jgi:hypothetical protein